MWPSRLSPGSAATNETQMPPPPPPPPPLPPVLHRYAEAPKAHRTQARHTQACPRASLCLMDQSDGWTTRAPTHTPTYSKHVAIGITELKVSHTGSTLRRARASVWISVRPNRHTRAQRFLVSRIEMMATLRRLPSRAAA